MRLPDHLPHALATLGGIAAAMVTVVPSLATRGIGQASSTAAIAYVLGPIVTGAAALASWGLGVAVRAVVRRRLPESWVVSPWLVLATALGLAAWVVVGTRDARASAWARYQAAQPRVLVASVLISPTDGEAETGAREAVTLLSRIAGPVVEPVAWNGRTVSATVGGDRLILQDEGGTVVTSIAPPVRESIIRVLAVPFCGAAGSQALGVLTMLRATSRRALLTIVDAQGATVYEELVERSSPVGSVRMAAGHIGTTDVLVLDLGTVVSRSCSSASRTSDALHTAERVGCPEPDLDSPASVDVGTFA